MPQRPHSSAPAGDIRQVDIESVRPYVRQAPPLGDCFVIDSLTGATFSGAALRFGFALMCYCRRGEAKFRRNGRIGELREGDLLLDFGGQVIEPLHTSPDFNGFVIVATHAFLSESLSSLRHIWPYLLQLQESPVVRLSAAEYVRLRENYLFVQRRMAEGGSDFLRETVLAMLRITLFDVADLLQRHFGPLQAGTGRDCTLFGDFLRLAADNFRAHRDLNWYAGRLCVSAKYLSAAVKGVSGRTASEWMAGMVLAEAQNLLRTTEKSVKEISSTLGFSSQSLFGVFFRKGTGLTPGSFRRQARQ
ncbi:MAG: helix-turn-helix domain-containing protein [Prevotellaceae bacterium]|nr:helix-turn-helix domain-containing protein [Prevotellaceae bacterium]